MGSNFHLHLPMVIWWHGEEAKEVLQRSVKCWMLRGWWKGVWDGIERGVVTRGYRNSRRRSPWTSDAIRNTYPVIGLAVCVTSEAPCASGPAYYDTTPTLLIIIITAAITTPLLPYDLFPKVSVLIKTYFRRSLLQC